MSVARTSMVAHASPGGDIRPSLAELKAAIVTHPCSETINAWCRAVLLPFWVQASWDRQHGGFFERLDRNGSVVPLDYKRTRLQGRQIYVFSQAALKGLLPEAAEAATSGVEFLVRNAWHRTDGGWVFKVSSDGRQQLDETRHLYCQAFALFGLGWYLRWSKDPEILGWADKTLGFIDARMRHSAGGYWNLWTSSMQRAPLPRLQNPHMHLLEALLVLADGTQREEYLSRAQTLVTLFCTHLCPRPHHRVGEYFDDGWRIEGGSSGSRHEPGHHFEWISLLHQYRRLAGDRSVAEVVEPLLDYTLRHGVDHTTGGLRAVYDEINADGFPLVTSKRLWPQTEMLKALVAAFDWSGDDKYRIAAQSALKLIIGTFMHGGEPLFQEQYDSIGRPVGDYAPVSSLYHLTGALNETARVLE